MLHISVDSTNMVVLDEQRFYRDCIGTRTVMYAFH